MSDVDDDRPQFSDVDPQRTGIEILGFPLRIEIWFFVTAFLIGPRGEPLWALAWIATVLVGVLLHELGHAIVGRRLGLAPWIQLHAFGGLTGWRRPRRLTPLQEIAVSAAGPAVGVAIGGTLFLAGYSGVAEGEVARRLLEYAIWVNLGWGVLNLLPVLPLDGGHIAASLARLALGERGHVAALALSIVLTVLLAGWALVSGQWWLAILGVVLTLSNARGLKAALDAVHGAGRPTPDDSGGDQ